MRPVPLIVSTYMLAADIKLTIKICSYDGIIVNLQRNHKKKEVSRMKKSKNKTTTCFTTSLRHSLPNFRTGVESISIIKSSDPFRRYMRGSDLSDLREDWRAIGYDLRKAMRKYPL